MVVVGLVSGRPRVVESMDKAWYLPSVSDFACPCCVYFWPWGFAPSTPYWPLCLRSTVHVQHEPALLQSRKIPPTLIQPTLICLPTTLHSCVFVAQLIVSCHLLLHFVPQMSWLPVSPQVTEALVASQRPGPWGRKSKEWGGKGPAVLSLRNSPYSRLLLSPVLRVSQIKWGARLSDL